MRRQVLFLKGSQINRKIPCAATFHSELFKDGEGFCSVVDAKEENDGTNNPVELGCTFETRDELEHAFEILKDGGTVTLDLCELPWSSCAAQVRDRFGVNWFLSMPQHRPPDDWTPADGVQQMCCDSSMKAAKAFPK